MTHVDRAPELAAASAVYPNDIVTVHRQNSGDAFYTPLQAGASLFGKLAYASTAASTAISNTASEALFDTNIAIPANALKAGSAIDVYFQGIATATNSTDTLTIKLKIGGLSGTAILTSSATDATNNDIFAGHARLQIRTIGAAGTFVASGSFTKVEAASGTATRVDAILASTSIDTTAAQTVGVTATWSVASASNSVRLDVFQVVIF